MTALTAAAMLRVVLVEAAALHVRAAADFRSMLASYPTAPQWAEAHDHVAALLTRELAATDGQPAAPRNPALAYLDAANVAQQDGNAPLAALLMRAMRKHAETEPRTRGDAVAADDLEPAEGDVVRADSDRSPRGADVFGFGASDGDAS